MTNVSGGFGLLIMIQKAYVQRHVQELLFDLVAAHMSDAELNWRRQTLVDFINPPF